MKSSLFFSLLFTCLQSFSNTGVDSTIYDLIQVDNKPLLKSSKDIKSTILSEFYKSGVLGEYEIHGTLQYTFVVNKDLTISSFNSIRTFNDLLYQKVKEITKNLKFKSPAYKNRQSVSVRIYIEFLVSTSAE
jgi:hypothetical protein